LVGIRYHWGDPLEGRLTAPLYPYTNQTESIACARSKLLIGEGFGCVYLPELGLPKSARGEASVSVRSLSSPIEILFVAEIAVAVLPGARVRPPPLPRGIAYDRDRGQAVSPDWSAVPNNRVRSMDGLGGVSSDRDIGRRSIHGRSRDAV